MLVYRDTCEHLRPASLLATCRRSLTGLQRSDAHDTATRLLIDFGMLEAGMVDALCPTREEHHPTIPRLRAATRAAGALFCRTARDAAELSAERRELERAILTLENEALPPVVAAKVPEGYAFYGLYPESYLAAAELLADERRLRPGSPLLVLGLRSIGTSLAAVVEAALAQRGLTVASATLRPRGHPFAREVVLGPELERWLAVRAFSLTLVVDEGPGISGSSMAAAADQLLALGYRADRIVLLPGHRPDPDRLCSARARVAWRRHAVAHVPFEATAIPGLHRLRTGRDLSGGAWRDLLLPSRPWPAVQPQHERRKYLGHNADGRLVLAKYVGLGQFGERSLARAVTLAAAGLGPAPLGLCAGFLVLPFIPGRPLTGPAVTRGLTDAALAHLSFRARHCRTGVATCTQPLLGMMRVNLATAAPGTAAAVLQDLDRAAQSWGTIEAVAPDNRLMPHEWVDRGEELIKTDALDHDRDHFYPGPADIAWDVAGFAVEFGLARQQAAEFAARLGGAIGDKGLPARLRFFEAAYAAFRFGYAVMAENALTGSDEAARWRATRQRYTAALAALASPT